MNRGAWWATVHTVRHDWVTNTFTSLLLNIQEGEVCFIELSSHLYLACDMNYSYNTIIKF